MQIFELPRLKGTAMPVAGDAGHVTRWGNGFRRERGFMALIDCGQQGYLAYHMDSRLNLENAILVERTSDLAGWFGYCPRAIAFYDACGIALKAA